MAILLQVGSAMHRGTIRRYIDTISGSSLRPAVSAVSLADSALLDPIELTQILRPHSLALVLSLLLSSSFSLLSPPLSLPPSFATLHSFTLACSRSVLFFLFLRPLVPSDRSYLLPLARFCPPFPFPPFHRCLLFIHSSARFLAAFFFSPPFFFFFFNSSRVMSVALYVKKFARM